jgi:PAS domain S-box-containing protein
LAAREGIPSRLIGVTMDVTDRKNAEQALREREARFRELADAMPQIVWSADAHGHVDYYNRRSLEYTRRRDREGWDRSWRDSMHPDDVRPTIDRWRHSVATGETYEIEYRFKDPQTGDYRWHLGRALPVRNEDGQIVRWLGTSTDIHDQKLAEQELAAALAEKEKFLELKTSLLREINHRVKNSLQLVSSLLNLQGRNINDPEVRFRFDEATRRVLTVARVHERLYETDNVDRMEFGQFLRELCQDVAKSLTGQVRRHVLTVDAPEYDVLVDQAIPLALVVNELVTNAFKYAFDDSRTGEVKVAMTLEDSHIRLIIADNGRGMPPGFDVGTSRGLGMILVNALTRQLKGAIRFEAGDPGATFVVTAPRIKNAQPGLRITSARVPLPFDAPPA